jgi:glycosyltransferase involved in cell wall biosynthesis
LTVHPRVYDQIDEAQLSEVPSQVKVIRAMGFDTRKHLSVWRRYPRYAALPDRWVTWCLGAIPAGIREIRKNKVDLIYTTFPVASAVLIGYLLHRLTGVPWVADFRDSMTEDNYPRDPLVRRVYRWLEKQAARHASRLIFTASSTRQMYLQRFPDLAAEKCLVISNGYDEQDFSGLSQPAIAHQDAGIRMQHSGLIYPEERDPVPFFQALARLKKDERISTNWFSVDLRACGHEERYREVVTQLGIEDLVRFLPALPYRQALQDSNRAEALLLLQGASCDHQIPAKAYEYIRLRKPILALTSQTGDTAALLNECGGATIVDLADQDAIYQALPGFLAAVRAGTHSLPRMETISRYSRQSQARELAHCLGEVAERELTAKTVSAAKRSQTAP